jgi:hypothetical protein
MEQANRATAVAPPTTAMGGRTRVNGDYTELRVVEVLGDNNGTPTTRSSV